MARQSTRPPLETIQAQLADPAYKVRKEAIRQIMRHYRPQACEPLLALLEDKRGDVRGKAVQALARLKDPRAFVPLLGLISDKNASVRAQVAGALGEFGDSSVVPLLIDLLNAPQPRLCSAAARSLGKLRVASSLPALLAYLERTRKAGDSTQLYYAAQALGDFGVPAVVEPLLALYKDSSSYSVQWAVADALRKVGASARPLLAQILIDQTRPVEVRACVAQALDRPAYPEYVPSLLMALDDPHPTIREGAAKALARLQDPCTVEPLTRLLNDSDPRVVAAAITALTALRAPGLVDTLIELLSDPSSALTVSYHAIEGLQALGDPRALQPLLDAFWRPDNAQLVVRLSAALTALNDAAIVEPLLEHLPGSSGLQRMRILELLGHFQDARSVEPLLSLFNPHASGWSEIRFQARLVRLLAKLGDPRAIEPLRAGLSHASGDLHTALQDILEHLGAQVPG